MKGPQPRRRPRGFSLLSPLHSKGLLTLCLLLIAESITVSNAVKLATWSDNVNAKAPYGLDECREGSCPATTPSSPPIARRMGRLSRRLTGRMDCCSCTQKALQACRGGHATAEVVEAASKVLPRGIPLNGWKVIFQAFLTTLNVLCWLIPLKSKKISDNKLALSLANAFSGGVFLSLAFGHLIPECVHGFEGYNEVTPFLLVLSGYLLIFFVEKVAFDAHEIMHEMEHAQDKKQNGEDAASSGRSAVILLGALAVHSVLEMAALGLASSFKDSAILTLSIALHQVR